MFYGSRRQRALIQRFDKENSRIWRRIWTCKIQERLKMMLWRIATGTFYL